MAQRKHEPGPPMDLANMREQGVHHEINHLAKSATFLAAYESGDEQELTQAVIYCSGHRIPLWEWFANELVVPFHRARPAMPNGED
ncbi:MAG: hypothetical protein WAM77_00975 [Xanthobacteraceae bacterium]|jgi:hypothetical protein